MVVLIHPFYIGMLHEITHPAIGIPPCFSVNLHIPFGNQTYLPSGNQTLQWKIPELNGCFLLGKSDKWSIFQPAMFDHRRVWVEHTCAPDFYG